MYAFYCNYLANPVNMLTVPGDKTPINLFLSHTRKINNVLGYKLWNAVLGNEILRWVTNN